MCALRRVPGLLICVLCLGAVGLQAQLNRGIIEGHVTDPQGLAVPGASVTVTALQTNVSISASTNQVGYYRAVDLVPGNYEIHIEARGFSPVDVKNITVSAGGVFLENVVLELGRTTQTVEVKAGASSIQTAPTNISTGVGNQVIQNIPLQGRDIQQLVFLVPGVIANGPPGSNFGFNSQFGAFPDPSHVQGSDVSVNGGKAGASAWYLDGNLNLSAMAQNVVIDPSPDAVQEFQAITNAYSAEYGRTGGAIFNVVLKSGTNKVHGSIYEYDRNSFFNARNPFTSISATGQIIPQDQLRYNDFGMTLGGPVILPHIYDGKNKTFFFLSWDMSILHLNGNQAFTVPTPLMRAGNFSEDPNTALYGIWNPYSTAGPNSSGVFQRTAFGTPVSGNPYGANGCTNTAAEAGGVGNCKFSPQLPPSSLDPTAMFFVNSFPQPNYLDPLSTCPLAAGGAYRICNNYLGGIGSSQDGQNISLKIDENWSEKSHIFGEWLYNPLTYNNYRLPWTGPTFPAVGFGSNEPFQMSNQIVALGNTYTFSPTLINEFRISYSRQFYTTHPSRSGYSQSISDLPAVEQKLSPSNIPQVPPTPIPSFSVYSPGGGSMQFGAVSWTNNLMATDAYTILDNLTKVMGKHTFKTGFMFQLSHAGQFQSGPTTLEFSGDGVVDPTTGLGGGGGLAQFELGAAMNDGGNYLAYSWDPYLTWPYYGAYVQDDFHITPRLTLNFGLRYNIFEAFHSRQQPLSRFCYGCKNPATGLPGEVLYAGQPGFPQGSPVVPTNYNDLAPRFNFAWMPFGNSKTVVRGGYDIFYSNEYNAINEVQSFVNIPGWVSDNYWQGSYDPTQCAPFSGQCVAWSLSSSNAKAPLTTPPFTNTFDAQHNPPSQVLGGYMQPVPPLSHDPWIQSWDLEVQRQLPDQILLTVGYAGTRGTHLLGGQYNYLHDPTAALQKYRESIHSVVPITNFYSGLPAQALAATYGTPDLPISNLLYQYPFWSFFVNAETFNGSGIYNALDVRLQKHYSHGLQWNLAYTFSKNIVNPFAAWGSTSGFTVDPMHNFRQGFTGGMFGALGVGQPFSPPWQNYDNINGDRALAPFDTPQTLSINASYQLPFGNGRKFFVHKGIRNAIIGGWNLDGIFSAQSGVPLTITGPCNGITCRPNLVGNPRSFSGSRTKAQQIAQWFNPAAFTPVFGTNQSFWANPDVNSNQWWQFGTAGIHLPGARSPAFWNLDSAVSKDFHITESKYFQFHWEVFNTLNHQNLGLPNTTYCLPPGPSGQTNLVQQAGCAFGQITNVQTDPRSMQFGLQFFW